MPIPPRKILLLVFIFIAIAYVFLLAAFRWSNGQWQETIDSDGKGYFAYTEHLFLTNSFGSEPYDRDYHVLTDDGQLNKFTCGTALMQLPFFGMATAWAAITGYSLEISSLPFQVMVSVAGLFYLLASLFVLMKILQRLNISTGAIVFILLGTAFGTPALNYSVLGAALSHIYSFFLFTCFIYLLILLRAENSLRIWLWLALVFSLIVLVRPVNGLVVLLAPAFGGGKFFFKHLFQLIRQPLHLLLVFITFFAPLFLQMILWQTQTGNWFEWSYKNEGFYFSDPQINEVLAGARKGAFIYYPIFIPCLAGLFLWRNTAKISIAWILVYFIIFTWIIASWWCWDYGESFGLRPFTETTIIFILLFALVLQSKLRWLRWSVSALAVLATFLNLIYTYQFHFRILPQSGMNWEKLEYIFLKTDRQYVNSFGGAENLPPYAPNGLTLYDTCTQTFDFYPDSISHTGGNLFPGGCAFIIDKKLASAPGFFAKIQLDKKITTSDGAKNAELTVQIIRPDGSINYLISYFLKRFREEPVNTWQEENYSISANTPMYEGDELKFYIFNEQNDSFEVDNFRTQLYYPIGNPPTLKLRRINMQ